MKIVNMISGYTNDQASLLSGHQYTGSFTVSVSLSNSLITLSAEWLGCDSALDADILQYLLPRAIIDAAGNATDIGSYTVNTNFAGQIEPETS